MRMNRITLIKYLRAIQAADRALHELSPLSLPSVRRDFKRTRTPSSDHLMFSAVADTYGKDLAKYLAKVFRWKHVNSRKP